MTSAAPSPTCWPLSDVGAEVIVVKTAMNHSTGVNVTAHRYLDKIKLLWPCYQRLETSVLKRVGVATAKTVEVDAETFKRFQEFQTMERAAKKKPRK